MALFNCPECGAQISDKAAACPKCGVTINSAPAAINLPARRTPTISDRTALGIMAAMAAVMYGLCAIPWFILLNGHNQGTYIWMSYWGIAAIGLSFATIGFAFTKQWLAAAAAVVTGMGAAAATCFDFKDSIIITSAPTAEMPDYKILYAVLVVFILTGTIAAAVGAIKFAERHIPDRRERKTEFSWTQFAGITLCALLSISYYTVWSNITIYDNPTPMTGQSYILSNITTICLWVAMFGICTRRWIATAILAAINMLYGIYTLTTDGFSGTYHSSFYDDREGICTTFAGGIYVMIIFAALLLALSVIADKRQNAQTAEA